MSHHMPHIMKRPAGVLVFALALAFVFSPGDGRAQERGFQFGVIGDTPYPSKMIKQAARAIKAMNRAQLAFVVHIGDFQSGSWRRYSRDPSAYKFMPCSDQNMAAILDLFRLSAHPFILTPGDNDWTDCPRFKSGNFDSLERLAKVRSMFFPNGKSLGRRAMAVESQGTDPGYSKFVENLTWKIGGVVFATLHIVGSNDNFTSGKQPKMDAEHKQRMAANLAWMKKAFAAARSSAARGLVIMAHANPRFENHWRQRSIIRYTRGVAGLEVEETRQPSVFDTYSNALRKEMETYPKPVLYIHGSTHIFRVNKPLFGKKGRRAYQNFTRLETFGAPDTHWVRVTVDPGYPGLFSIRPEIIPENRAHHRK